MKKRKKPATPFEWAIYRVEINREIAKEMIADIDEKDITYKNFGVARYLLDIVGDLTTAIEILKKGKTK